MNHNQHNIIKTLENNKIIPVVTIENSFEINKIIDNLIEKQIYCIEVTLRTKYSWSAIETIKSKYSEKFEIGIGTVINEEQIKKSKDFGVDFIVTPGVSSKLLESLIDSNIPFIPGTSNVSDIILALENNCNYLKFFPAILSGGIKTLSNFSKLFPEVYFCPTGGINAINFKEFLELKNVISVGGSWLIK